MKNKIVNSFAEAVADIPNGATLATFAWGLGRGTPQNLIRALHEKGVKDLTVISFNFTLARVGSHSFLPTEVATPVLLADQVKKVHTAFPGTSYYHRRSRLMERIAAGEVELDIMSHGTLAERLRAGGSGLGGFYTTVGVGTIVEKGKEKRVIDGKEHILETPLRPEFGFVRAYKADKMGNLVYRGSVRGGNPLIAMSSKVAIAEVDEIVEVGELDPEAIVTPGVYVNRIVKIPEGSFGSRSHMEALFHKTLQMLRDQGAA